MPAFGQGSIKRAHPHKGRGLGESPPTAREVHPRGLPIPGPPATPVHSRVQRVPPSGESSLSEDKLNVLRARQGRAGEELSSPQAVPAVPVGLPGRVLQLSDQDVPERNQLPRPVMLVWYLDLGSVGARGSRKGWCPPCCLSA